MSDETAPDGGHIFTQRFTHGDHELYRMMLVRADGHVLAIHPLGALMCRDAVNP